jgi:hypothetical protein
VKRIVFLLEEQSMAETLKILLPKILPQGIDSLCLAQNGKADLQKMIPIKMRRWQLPDTEFVIMQDQDANDCVKLKQQLRELAKQGGIYDCLIRIVCDELESWFLGDIAALEKGFGLDLSVYKDKAKYRNPDNLQNAKQELKALVPSYQQISGPRAIAPYMDISANRSYSFNVFVEGVKRLCEGGKNGNS